MNNQNLVSSNLNKNQSKLSTERQNQYLDYLIDPSFQRVNRLFVSSFEDKAQRTSYKWYHPPTVEKKIYNAMIDEQNFFDKPLGNSLRTYDSIREIVIGQGDDYTTGCLLGYNCVKNFRKMIAIDLSKQQALNADPKATQQVNFAVKINGAVGATMFFVIEEPKETVLIF